MQQTSEQSEELPSEVIMLCSLLARIIYRCLKERDARLLVLLKEPAGEHLKEQDTIKDTSPPD
jgi:hypothetical protein